jgi:hypothetical protein
MSGRRKFKRLGEILLLCLISSCLGVFSPARADSPQTAQSQPPLIQPTNQTQTNQPKTNAPKTRKTKKPQKPPLAPLPSGPTGPVQQVPLDSMSPVPPQVSYQNSQLTIVAPNSTLGDILRAVRKQTGAEIEIPAATERVVTHLGPGPAREVVAELLNGSRFNYVILGSPADNTVLTRVVLVAKTGPDNAAPNTPAVAEQPNGPHPGGPGEANEAEATEDDAADQAAAEAEQTPPPADQPGVKTPQQMLQEMQQRQLQLQQQQQSGQPLGPGQALPQRPPQEQ